MHPALVKTAAKELPDFEIAQRIAAGDREELRLLMRRYNQRLYRAAFVAAPGCRPGWCASL
jgi:hypothetical protein